MSEKERQIVEKLKDAIPKMSEFDKGYILGKTESLADGSEEKKKRSKYMELQIFNSEEFGEIRTITKDNEPMFCLADVCKALEISNVGNVKQRLSEKGIHTADTPTKGGLQKMIFINEANLYKTIFQSRKESAERFTEWVTSEVLPSIRKNGGYIAGQETLSDEELMAKALLVANNKIAERDKIIEQKQARIEQMKPKEIFADAVATSHTSILVGDLAKLICQNGYQIGQKRLFSWLRDNGYLIKGKKVLARELSSIAEKHLKIEIRDDKKHNKVSQKQYEKFMDLLKEGDSE